VNRRQLLAGVVAIVAEPCIPRAPFVTSFASRCLPGGVKFTWTPGVPYELVEQHFQAKLAEWRRLGIISDSIDHIKIRGTVSV